MLSRRFFSLSLSILSLTFSIVTLSTVTTGCSILQNKSLSTDRAQKIVNIWDPEQSNAIKVIGVRETENNTAVAILQFSGYNYTNFWGQEIRGASYSGPGEANFSYYTDGYWVMTGVSLTQTNNLLGPIRWTVNVKENSKDNSAAKQLVGTWQREGTPDNTAIIFTPEGKMLSFAGDLDNYNLGNKKFATNRYQINSTHRPRHIDFFGIEGELAPGIFDFGPNGELFLDFSGLGVATIYRKDSFNSDNIPLKKISEEVRLPSGYTLLSSDEVAKLKERIKIKVIQFDAQHYVSSMLRGQQAFYLENSYFASKIEDLGLGVRTETDQYSYSIIVIDKKSIVQILAVPKVDGVKSFTGIVATSEGNQFNSIQCRSDQPTKDMPPRHETSDSCPNGFSRLK